MANHKKHRYLDPAHSVIRKFCKPGESLSAGIDAVAAITGAHRTNVYRWMLPIDARGTDGHIPAPQQRKLLDHARKTRLPSRLSLDPEDFFIAAKAA